MTTTAPLYRLEAEARRRHAEQFVGLLVAMQVDTLRGAGAGDPRHAFTLNGRLLSIATPLVGTVADVAVIRHRHDSGRLIDYAVSLATVVSITPA